MSAAVGAAALCAALLACGGGGGGGGGGGSLAPPPPVATASNVATVIVDGGPLNNSVNTLFTSVTVCVPGSTTNCQTIDHIQVDTGSYGLRLLASVLTLMLPVQTASSGGSLVECTSFADGYSWGPVALADVQIAGETAGSLPIQVIGDSRFPKIPSDCSSSGIKAEDTVMDFGANGLLGIGVFTQDCGQACASQVVPHSYYVCSSTTCLTTTALTTQQVANPISKFAVDNNGSFISLPSVAQTGTTTITGSLIFGVDTRSNNASGTETVLTVDPGNGKITTVFNTQTLTDSFIDSGSNGTFFNDSSLTVCMTTLTSFYCPAVTQPFTASLKGTNGVTVSESFSVGNAQTMLSNNPSFNVLPNLAGTFPGGTTAFDWGLPFFYGRRVANVIEGNSTSAGAGPYIAF